MMLKVDLHTHTAEDPLENINYDAFRLIDRASQDGFDVLAITNHKLVTYNEELAEYAEKKGILLISLITMARVSLNFFLAKRLKIQFQL